MSDTGSWALLARRGDAPLRAIFRRSDRVLMSSVVAGELLYGYRKGRRFEVDRNELLQFLDSPWVQLLPVTLVTADRFGMILASLKRKGRPIPTNDIWIAAHALESGADLVTFDRHFDRIHGLSRIDPLAWQ